MLTFIINYNHIETSNTIVQKDSLFNLVYLSTRWRFSFARIHRTKGNNDTMNQNRIHRNPPLGLRFSNLQAQKASRSLLDSCLLVADRILQCRIWHPLGCQLPPELGLQPWEPWSPVFGHWSSARIPNVLGWWLQEFHLQLLFSPRPPIRPILSFACPILRERGRAPFLLPPSAQQLEFGWCSTSCEFWKVFWFLFVAVWMRWDVNEKGTEVFSRHFIPWERTVQQLF